MNGYDIVDNRGNVLAEIRPRPAADGRPEAHAKVAERAADLLNAIRYQVGGCPKIVEAS